MLRYHHPTVVCKHHSLRVIYDKSPAKTIGCDVCVGLISVAHTHTTSRTITIKSLTPTSPKLFCREDKPGTISAFCRCLFLIRGHRNGHRTENRKCVRIKDVHETCHALQKYSNNPKNKKQPEDRDLFCAVCPSWWTCQEVLIFLAVDEGT